MTHRRNFLKMAGAVALAGRTRAFGAVRPSGGALAGARALVANGVLGRISMCRISDFHGIDVVQFVMGQMTPLSVSAQHLSESTIVTYRYRGFLVCQETGAANLPHGAVFHGDRATLAVNDEAAFLFAGGGEAGKIINGDAETWKWKLDLPL